MTEITTHRLSPADDTIGIHVTDEPGAGLLPLPGLGGEGASPLRERMVKRVAYWKSLRTLSDEQEAALEFWEAYLAGAVSRNQIRSRM